MPFMEKIKDRFFSAFIARVLGGLAFIVNMRLVRNKINKEVDKMIAKELGIDAKFSLNELHVRKTWNGWREFSVRADFCISDEDLKRLVKKAIEE